MMIANPLIALVYVGAHDFVKKGAPHAPDWAFSVLAVLAGVNLVAAIGMWNWNKWGVVLTLALSLVAFFVNMVIGVPMQNTLMGFGGPLIIIVLVKPLWRGFT